MKVLSLFDGMSCGQLALERAGIKVSEYYASEVDKYAIQITHKNFPDTIQLGDVQEIGAEDLPGIDLLIGGSPCQGFSFAGKQLNFDDERSKLFFEFVRLLEELQPSYFLLENVKMKKEYQDVITEYLGVEPIKINSALVSAQNRERLYWTNIPGIEQPKDKGILLQDIVLEDVFPVALHNLYGGFKEKSVRVFEGKSPTLRTAAGGGHIPSFVKTDLIHSEKAIEYMDRKVKGGRTHWDFKHHSDIRNEKSAAIVANFFKGVPYNVFKDWDCVRKFHPIECERLQTLPDNYTEGVSNTQRYKMIGNGWTVDVIAHIFESLKTAEVSWKRKTQELEELLMMQDVVISELEAKLNIRRKII
jgi:DNA-cytosine methyltransferase